jgi:uncharacterized protein (TIGR00730 family)
MEESTIFDTVGELKAWVASPCIAVFGSYAQAEGSGGYTTARELGRTLARHGYAVCSGGYAGVMEAVLRGATDEGGITVTALTKYFDFLDLRPNAWVKAAVMTHGLVDRMDVLYQIGDGFVVLPGSTGTLAELAITLELVNKNPRDRKPIVCFGRYWDPLVKIVGDEPRPFHPNETVSTLVRFADNPAEVVAALELSALG